VYLTTIDGDVDLALDADDCLTLARACNLAQWVIGTEQQAQQVQRLFNLPGKTRNDRDIRHLLGLYQTLENLFMAAGMALEAQDAAKLGQRRNPTLEELRTRPPATLPPWLADAPLPTAD
jgi:hypothetical protein